MSNVSSTRPTVGRADARVHPGAQRRSAAARAARTNLRTHSAVAIAAFLLALGAARDASAVVLAEADTIPLRLTVLLEMRVGLWTWAARAGQRPDGRWIVRLESDVHVTEDRPRTASALADVAHVFSRIPGGSAEVYAFGAGGCAVAARPPGRLSHGRSDAGARLWAALEAAPPVFASPSHTQVHVSACVAGPEGSAPPDTTTFAVLESATRHSLPGLHAVALRDERVFARTFWDSPWCEVADGAAWLDSLHAFDAAVAADDSGSTTPPFDSITIHRWSGRDPSVRSPPLTDVVWTDPAVDEAHKHALRTTLSLLQECRPLPVSLDVVTDDEDPGTVTLRGAWPAP